MDRRAADELAGSLGLYRLLDPDGRPVAADVGADALATAPLAALHAAMVTQRAVDVALTGLVARQRLTGHAPLFGLEGAVLGAASALGEDDWLFPTPPPIGVARMRGATLEEGLARAFGNLLDPGAGRVAPTSPVAEATARAAGAAPGAHLLHAAGVARALQLRRADPAAVALAFVGAAATESGDLQSALRLAAKDQLPLVLVAVEDAREGGKRRVPSPSDRAHAHRVPVARVDGGDAAACRAATREAVQTARDGLGPTLVEVTCWRLPTLADETLVKGAWAAWDPVARLGRWLTAEGALDPVAAAAARGALEADLDALIAIMEVQGPPPAASLVDGVLAATPPHLAEQAEAALAADETR